MQQQHVKEERNLVALSDFEAHKKFSNGNINNWIEILKFSGSKGLLAHHELTNERTKVTTMGITAVTANGDTVMIHYLPENLDSVETFAESLLKTVRKLKNENQYIYPGTSIENKQ